jgi:gliding motility-associated-like protein
MKNRTRERQKTNKEFQKIKRNNYNMMQLKRCFIHYYTLILFLFPAMVFAQAPVANFTVSKSSSCGSGIIKFTDKSTNAPTSWLWEFGGAIPNSTVKSPTINFTVAGTYNVKLTASNASGSGVFTQSIVIYPLPVPVFSASVTSSCAPLATQFTDQSVAGAGATITSRNWNFGDGSTSISTAPQHNYSIPGQYSVTLSVTDSRSCVSKPALVKTNYITVNANPAHAFTATPAFNCSAPFAASFSTPDAGIGAKYYWTFGDGKKDTVRSPVNTYAAVGSYTVSLVTITGAGCRDTVVKNKYISISNFTVDFKSDVQKRCVTLPIQFTDLSTPANSYSYLWDFGDGTTSTAQNPSHSYAVAGTFTVSMTATDNSGPSSCTKQMKKTAYIKIDPKPLIGFTASSVSECAVPASITFTDTTKGAVKWRWTFAPTDSANTLSATYVYKAQGSYPGSLTVTDGNGCVNSITKNNFINIVFPKANFKADKFNGCVPLGVNFKDSSMSVEKITKWSWNFGDKTAGVNTLVPTVSHNYIDTGVFDVTLIITNVKGCIDSIKMKKYISPGMPPTVAFSGLPVTGCFPLTTVFKDASSGFADSWLWNFGDGSTSALKNPSHRFPDVGYYDISLTPGFHNCLAAPLVKVKYIFVQSPRALFSSTTTIGCKYPFDATFVDNSKGAVTYLWDFGDPTSGINNTSTAPNPPVHSYKNPGFYTVKLVVKDPVTGCSDTIVKPSFIKVSNLKPGFTTGGQIGCQPFIVPFMDTSVTNTSVANWQWDFGDGFKIAGSGAIPPGSQTSGNFNAPTHTYTTPGSFTVKMKVTDQLGCSDSSTKPSVLIVKQLPIPKFGVDKLTGCAPLNVMFTDSSKGAGANTIVSRSWDFGDGTPAVIGATTLPHIYTTRGKYIATLTVTDNQQCSNSYSKTIVPTFPTASFTIDPVACNKKVVSIVNNSSYPNSTPSYSWDFGDGTPIDTAKNPKHAYNLPASANITVKLVVTDNNQCKNSSSQPVIFSRPVANFKATTTFTNCPPGVINFVDSSYSTSSASDAIKKRFWNFGDPASGAANTVKDSLKPTHTFQIPAKYDVFLIVTNTYGCQDTMSKPKYISIGGSIFDSLQMSIAGSQSCPPVEATFRVWGKNIASYQLIYGDGNTDSVATKPNMPNVIKHVYTNSGSYSPIVLLTDSTDKSNPASKTCTLQFPSNKTINVFGPVINFDPDSSFYCGPADVSFSQNLSAGDVSIIDTWLWNFGDSTTYNDINPPVHHYSKPGSYNVSLTGTVQGCPFTKTKKNNIVIFTPSPIKFTMSDSAGCIPLSIKFKPVPATITMPISKWIWKFGTGDSLAILDSAQVYSRYNTTYSYKTAGSFYPTFSTVFKKGNCRIDYNLNNKVFTLGRPDVNFDFTPVISENTLNTFAFTNKSPEGVSFYWTFGDSSNATIANPTHTYLQEGLFPVTLNVKNALGCPGSLKKTVKSTSGLVIGNAFTPNGDGINDKFNIDLPGAVINKFSIEVYDRWGNLVYEATDYKNDWDGKDMNGKILPYDSYYYILKYNNRYSWNGYVTILRGE